MKNGDFSIRVLRQSDKALSRISRGENLDNIVDELRNRKVGPAVADLLFNYFRNKAIIDFLITKFSKKSNKNATSKKFLRIIALVFTQAKFQTGIDDFAAVDVGVGFSKRKYGNKVAGFINAILRSLLAEDFATCLNEAPDNVRLNMPEQHYLRWLKEFGKEKLAKFSEVFHHKPLLTFRLIGDIPESELAEKGCQEFFQKELLTEYRFFEVAKPSVLFASDWLTKGKIYIQDVSTLSPCLFFEPSDRDFIYDLCSAPGGKSLILLERMKNGILVSADISFKRQQRTLENLSKCRQKYSAVIVSSALMPALKPCSADWVLLDVPCSNTGVIRRRPDVLWNLTENKINDLILLQRKIISNGANLVRLGGKIIYSTCSIESRENQVQVKDFLMKHKNFELTRERLLLPDEHHDGGYAALLTKISS